MHWVYRGLSLTPKDIIYSLSFQFVPTTSLTDTNHSLTQNLSRNVDINCADSSSTSFKLKAMINQTLLHNIELKNNVNVLLVNLKKTVLIVTVLIYYLTSFVSISLKNKPELVTNCLPEQYD